ncbi:MAG: hypothetical protein J7K65_01185 [Planctomycetes bacterium]|nr:hypothetical protein [Planctomycetota bacterium]
MKVKSILLGILIVIASLFLIAAVGIDVLVENKAFRATVSGRITNTEGNPVAGASTDDLSIVVGQNVVEKY